jgi:hypothetical protein
MGATEAAADDGLIPTQHGSSKYDVLATIGEGAYGTVLRARHRVTGEIVAIKRIRESDGELLYLGGERKSCFRGWGASGEGRGRPPADTNKSRKNHALDERAPLSAF